MLEFIKPEFFNDLTLMFCFVFAFYQNMAMVFMEVSSMQVYATCDIFLELSFSALVILKYENYFSANFYNVECIPSCKNKTN